MGHVEENSKKRARNNNLRALILGSVAIGGVLAVGLVAPNVLSAMGKLGLLPKSREDEYIGSARRRLKKQGLLVERDGFLRITPKGRRQLQSLSLSFAKPSVLRRWDGKWRVLIFDIPERRRTVRAGIRRQLQSSGFRRIQDSVWLFPYPCEEFVALLKSELRIGRDMLYLVVDALEGDNQFRTAFALPLSNDPVVAIPPILDSVLSTILPKAR